MRARGRIGAPTFCPCVHPSLGARDTPLPYTAEPRTAGLVVRLPTWAGQTITLPTWGSIYPPTRSVRMGQDAPGAPVEFLPEFLHEPWVPGALEGEEAGMSPSLDAGPAWWHLYPPPWQVRGPFETPTRHLHLGAVLRPVAPSPASVLRPVALKPQPWSWGGANYPVAQAQPAGAHAVLTAVPTKPGAALRPRLMGPGDWTPQPDGSVTAPDGSPGWRDNADGTYTNSVVAGQGQVIVYTVDASMAPLTTLVVPPGQATSASVPPPSGAPGKPITFTAPMSRGGIDTRVLIGGAAAALFLLAALVQKR